MGRLLLRSKMRSRIISLNYISLGPRLVILSAHLVQEVWERTPNSACSEGSYHEVLERKSLTFYAVFYVHGLQELLIVI